MSAEAHEKANTTPRVPSATAVILLRKGYEGQVDAPLQTFHWPKLVPSLPAHRRCELPTIIPNSDEAKQFIRTPTRKGFEIPEV